MRPLGRKDLRSVQHQHLAHALGAFPPAENKNAGCNAGTVEEPLAQGDNGLDQVAFDKLLTNLTFGIATEKNALRQDDGDTSVLPGHRRDHVLKPGIVTAAVRRCSPEIASISVVGPFRRSPLVKRERRIGDHALEPGQLIARDDLRVAQRVTLDHIKIRRAVKEEVHLRNGGIRDVLLLSVNRAAAQRIVVHVVDGFDQHAARTACGIIDAFAGLRIENAHKQLDHGAGCIELARLLLRLVGKLLQQNFVGIAHQISRIITIPQPPLGKVIQKIGDAPIRKNRLIRPVRRAEDRQNAIQRIRVREFYLPHRSDNRRAQVFGPLSDICPMAALGDYKTVLLREKRIFLVSAGFFQRAITFLIPHVADALEVQKRRNVILEVLMAHRTANDITCLIQKRIKILRPR